VTCLRLASLIAFVLWSSPITKLADGLGAQRIPDPTTSGDFTRRFGQDSVLKLMEAINAARQRDWEKQPEDFLWQAFVDIDGTLAGTLGECKGGMALSYKGIWGLCALNYHFGQYPRSPLSGQPAWLQAMIFSMRGKCAGNSSRPGCFLAPFCDRAQTA
jgi:hypothetical protein